MTSWYACVVGRSRGGAPPVVAVLLAGLLGAHAAPTFAGSPAAPGEAAPAQAVPVPARTALDPDLLLGFARAAGRIVHGRCLAAEPLLVEVAGARVAATRYTFAVDETFKGEPAATLVFHQVGTPEGGARDLGRLVGLPVYRPGAEYLLFLLQPGRSGLTSPAGAGEAAYAVEGRALRPLAAGHFLTARGLARRAAASAGRPQEVTTLEALRALLGAGEVR